MKFWQKKARVTRRLFGGFLTKFFAVATALSFAIFSACDRVDSVLAEKNATFSTAFPISLGKKKLSLRIAITDLERRQGLTGVRLDSNADAGMLFVYADSAQRAFWMRDVPADLSIGFFDANGQLLEMREMFANDTGTTYSHARAVKFALEMPPRWFEKNAVLAGEKLDLHALASALQSRGFSPENFDLAVSEK